ncbi:hypothetical protein J5N97_014216 [Dioscorea zingiberensis]|uniref:Uncharacterized protein n=1 Tax=Dioscorea zingiberensis TaxID=325984 RepID=A0A9D5CTI9_9LILI|nr:hypothetical protein J5N97_014216 [Dioscorea zingiberensis]
MDLCGRRIQKFIVQGGGRFSTADGCSSVDVQRWRDGLVATMSFGSVCCSPSSATFPGSSTLSTQSPSKLSSG